MSTIVRRHHDFCAGHRVVGHESKCANLHGHNYRVHFAVKSSNGILDNVGRVVDFSVVKDTLCRWIEDKWDHKMLLWDQDAIACVGGALHNDPSVVAVPFNPTAENMARFLIDNIGPYVLPSHLILTEVTIEETRKCSVTETL